MRKIRNWNPAVYGRLPYVFGFASAGYKFRLYALHPQPVTLEVIKTQIGRELNLALVMDALQLVQWVFYLARLIDLLSEEIEDAAPPIGTPWKRKSGRNSIITIYDDYVEKQLVSDKEHRYKWSELRELYALQLPNVVSLKEEPQVSENKVTLKLAPLGFRGQPKTLKEVRVCLLDILKALKGMHDNFWVHRDVKLANIVRCLNGSWMLIDLDLAEKLDPATNEAPWPFFDRPGYPMPHRNNDENWKPKHDIKQVAIMLSDVLVLKSHPEHGRLIKSIDQSNNASEAIVNVENFQFEI